MYLNWIVYILILIALVNASVVSIKKTKNNKSFFQIADESYYESYQQLAGKNNKKEWLNFLIKQKAVN